MSSSGRLGLRLTAALAVAAAACAPQPDARPPRIAYAAVQLNVHEAPAATATVLAQLRQGTAVAVGTCEGGWCGVATNVVAGYAEQAYLSDSAPPPPTTQRSEGRGYRNAYGEWVRSPTWTPDSLPPPGATAQCGDGSYSFSNTRRGTCSRHGGVARWLPRADSIRR